MNTLLQLQRGELAGTSRLDLACGLTELPPEVLDLADSLEVLNLTGNRLKALPTSLARCRHLKIVFASNNDFEELPEVLGALPALQIVGFRANRIRQVSAAAVAPALRSLVLTDNAIEALPDALGERPTLQKLMLTGNRLRTLPDALAGARSLELLRLSANPSLRLPGWLPELPRLAWLALAGHGMGWTPAEAKPLPAWPWHELRIGGLLGEGASGQIFKVGRMGHEGHWALKLFKGALSSDGLPESELQASLAAGQHPALCTPVARLREHPDGLAGLLMPLIPAGHRPLAAPPSLESLTRDVYAPGHPMNTAVVLSVARQTAQALAHLHGQGLLHGDVYAHNILCDASSGQALLSDLGAAAVLPADQPALTRRLQASDVLAYGLLLEELLAHSPGDGEDEGELAALAALCCAPVPGQRPAMAEVARRF
jgi:hypothetical protein